MTQATSQIGADQSGLAYRNADNAGKQAILNHHKGPTAPTYAEAGIIWLNDSATPWTLNVYNGASWITLGEVNATTNTFQAYNGTAASRLINYAADTGAANAYLIAPSPAVPAYAAGQIVTLKPAYANTGAATLNVSSLGVKSVKLLDGNDPFANALLATGVYTLVYDGTNFVLLNPTLPAFTGDSGTGGASGLVPAPAAGDAAAGKVLGAGGAWVAAGGVAIKRQIFTASGSYTPSAGLLYAEVEVLGAGGGAGGSPAAFPRGGGGGAGAYSMSVLGAAAIGAAQTVTIGAGGAGGAAGANPGSAGGASSFGTLVTANGGSGGDSSTTLGSYLCAGGQGGAAATGDIAIAGNNGGFSGDYNGVVDVGIGANSKYGAGGATASATAAGANGAGYGAGGCGSIGASLAGGNGSGGLVIVTEYCSV